MWHSCARLAVRRLPGIPAFSSAASGEGYRGSLRLSRPYRALTHYFPAKPRRSKNRLAPGRTAKALAALMTIGALQRVRKAGPCVGGGAESRRGPLVAFLRFERTWPPRPTEPSEPGLLHPGGAPELSPSGLSAARRSDLVTEVAPSLPFGAALWRRVRLRRVDPSEQQPRYRLRGTAACPPGLFPSGAFPFTVVAPASRRLLSRA